MITHAVGISLGATSSVESGIAVREISSGKIIYLDKLFSMNDINLFFENYPSLKNSIICASLPWDITMLDGKWRVLSKPYQLIHTLGNFQNTNNWMQRFSMRGCDLLSTLKENGINVFRYELYLTRQKLNLYSNYKERSSADCKFLQNILRNEYGFEDLPSNMLPVAQLEAIIGTILVNEYLNNNTQKIFEFKNIDVINVIK